MTTRNFNPGSDITGIIDLSRLPPPSFVDPKSLRDIEDDLKRKFQEILAKNNVKGVSLGDSDPLSFIIELIAFESLKLREKINREALQCLLPYARGSRLDQLLALVGEARGDLDETDPATGLPKKESDDQFLKRALLSLDQYSTAGADSSYRYHVREFFKREKISLRDVRPYSPEPGTTRVVILLDPEVRAKLSKETAENGDKGDEALRKKTLAYLNSDELRPLTDKTEVIYAEVVTARFQKATVYTPKGVDPGLIKKEIIASLKEYSTRRFVINEPITESGIHAAITVTPDIYKVVLEGFNEEDYAANSERAYLFSVPDSAIEMSEG